MLPVRKTYNDHHWNDEGGEKSVFKSADAEMELPATILPVSIFQLLFVWFVIVIVICLIVGTMSLVSTTVHITVIFTTMITEYHQKYCPQSMSQYSEALRV